MINVLLFAQLQEDLGTDRLQVNGDGMTVEELKKQLQKSYHLPQLQQMMTAINEEYVNDQEMIKAGDTVAFIPPVSGG
ncbi:MULTISPECIES: molybdopterin converting factor subunit 1 [Virgibacillus]|uniref:Molybdopterin synthase sulfur carrier subunit n=1 Tax=Virgibacillus pantothenticus TaxID=1473 RepID=A0A0L0QUZ0_VIRPA|nr:MULTISPECIES: molybdopterin converting factor subunit 1 [Virgibacillus]API92570.1 molybdopterin converting factor subunit 1 [Virgibacillus sp. 6R]KNE22347.1 molybdenum cofactor biosynthesis protein MoaD [Virgibacillus pantothenticus]MBS7428054.1 molybdopterin converting factor subunit 1 [Virgibacillus sp. 19R1-5]MBU8567786.1 molybdopterin converting factor subunit 1 [Virgibacillus pantothenticus]MBU8601579.1 molybdopterin converting factor subunit 1 [Virgibacillus pantothenticus]